MHYIEKCECGKIMGQCRCPDKNKFVRVVSPCVHGSETGELLVLEDEEEVASRESLRGIDG